MDTDARARFRGDNIGLVFHAFNLLPALSAVDNVAVPLLIQQVHPDEAERRTRDMLETVGPGDRAARGHRNSVVANSNASPSGARLCMRRR